MQVLKQMNPLRMVRRLDREDTDQVHAYEILKKALTDDTFKLSLLANSDEVIRRQGVTESSAVNTMKKFAKLLQFGEDEKQQADALVKHQKWTTVETIDSFKTGLQNTVKQIDSGFRRTMVMYQVAFYLGIILIGLAVYAAVALETPLLSLAFGGLGVVDFLAFFIKRPVQHLQTSRAELAQLQAAFFNWFSDSLNWNRYLAKLEGTDGFKFPEFKKVSNVLLANTQKTMKLIEDYCGLSGKEHSNKSA